MATKDKSDDRQIQPFAAVLQQIAKGTAHNELSELLNQLTTAVNEHKKAGTLKLTIRVEPTKGTDGTGRTGSRNAANIARAICQANGPDADNWQDILAEEISEAFAETGTPLRTELIQCAAVIVAWIEAIDRRPVNQ